LAGRFGAGKEPVFSAGGDRLDREHKSPHPWALTRGFSVLPLGKIMI
jgi:hypothetical protein